MCTVGESFGHFCKIKYKEILVYMSLCRRIQEDVTACKINRALFALINRGRFLYFEMTLTEAPFLLWKGTLF